MFDIMMIKKIISLSLTSILLSACSNNPLKGDAGAPESQEDKRKFGFGSVVGDDTLVFGGNKKRDGGSGVGMMVNPYLWKASLDTVNFMPLVSADANGGVIVTDWYIDSKKPNERIKVTVYIRDIVLRADGVQVTVHKQIMAKGQWQNVTRVDPETATELENIILTKARNLRIQAEQAA